MASPQSFTGANLGIYNVKDYGAVGDGTTDDTTAIQAAIDSGKPAYLPPGTYKVTSTLTILDGESLRGSGFDSILAASSVSGAVVKLGAGGAVGSNERLGVSDIRITGTATRAIDIDQVQQFWVRNVMIGGEYTAASLTDGVRAAKCWDGEISNVSTNGSTITNAHFLFGELVSCKLSNLYTGGSVTSASNIAFKFDVSDNGGSSYSAGFVATNLTAQGTGYGVWFRDARNIKVDGLYVEEVLYPVVFGHNASSKFAINCSVHNIALYQITSAHAGYASRKAVVDFDHAVGCTVKGIKMDAMSSIYDVAPITFSGGGGSGALAVARMTAAGAIASVEVLYGGSGYTSDPTAAAANVTGETLVVTRSGTTVGSVAVSAGGSGGTMTNLYPIFCTYRYSQHNSIEDVSFYAGTTFSGHEWMAPIYPLVVRTAAGFGYSGVTIRNDRSFKQSGANYDGVNVDIVKAQGDNVHVLIEYNSSGTAVTNLYTPPVYP